MSAESSSDRTDLSPSPSPVTPKCRWQLRLQAVPTSPRPNRLQLNPLKRSLTIWIIHRRTELYWNLVSLCDWAERERAVSCVRMTAPIVHEGSAFVFFQESHLSLRPPAPRPTATQSASCVQRAQQGPAYLRGLDGETCSHTLINDSSLLLVFFT